MTSPPARHIADLAPDIVLYHADCLDGFGAAWAIWKRFPSAEFIPVKYAAPPPAGLAGRRIVIVDFTYPRHTLEALARDAAGILVLDHHITSQQTLADLPYTYFDQKKSGAVLAWEWAHQSPAPWLLQYVQDKDLWQWALPGSQEINTALMSHPFDFRLWDSFTKEQLEADGRVILRYENEMISKIVSDALLVPFEGQLVPAVQSSILNSQIGGRLSDKYPFVIIWHDRDGRRYYSLRSRASGGANVAAIASRYGGGGHYHAAGFSVPLGPDGPSPLDPLTKKKTGGQGRGARGKPRTRR